MWLSAFLLRSIMSKWSSAFRDSRWQRKRLEIMERDGWFCQSCGKKDGVALNVHHAYYESGKAPWEYPSECLITYCEDCHTKRHKLQNDLLVKIARIPMPSFVSSIYAVEYFPDVCSDIFDSVMGNGVPITAIQKMIEAIDLSFNAGLESHSKEVGEE